MSNGRAFRHQRPPVLDDPAPGDPNAGYASILQRATQKMRRENLVGYRRERAVYSIVLGVMVAALVGYLVIGIAMRLVP